jgi:hypothetical protein
MYITPEIFETEAICPANAMPHTTMAPVHITYGLQPSILGKRRRAGCDTAAAASPYASSTGHQDAQQSPLTSTRRSKLQVTIKSHEDAPVRYAKSLPSPPPEGDFGYELERTRADPYARSPPTKQSRRFIPMKKARLPVTGMTSTTTKGTNDAATPILTPCHVCYKAPRIKRELDAYEDCWRCKERTCFICMRECQAGCDRRKVCRQCCVEQGEDGDVSCLDCLQRSQDEEMED